MECGWRARISTALLGGCLTRASIANALSLKGHDRILLGKALDRAVLEAKEKWCNRRRRADSFWEYYLVDSAADAVQPRGAPRSPL